MELDIPSGMSIDDLAALLGKEVTPHTVRAVCSQAGACARSGCDHCLVYLNNNKVWKHDPTFSIRDFPIENLKVYIDPDSPLIGKGSVSLVRQLHNRGATIIPSIDIDELNYQLLEGDSDE